MTLGNVEGHQLFEPFKIQYLEKRSTPQLRSAYIQVAYELKIISWR